MVLVTGQKPMAVHCLMNTTEFRVICFEINTHRELLLDMFVPFLKVDLSPCDAEALKLVIS